MTVPVTVGLMWGEAEPSEGVLKAMLPLAPVEDTGGLWDPRSPQASALTWLFGDLGSFFCLQVT